MKPLHIGPDILCHGPDTLQNHIPQNVLPDIVRRTGSPPAFVLGTDVVILSTLKVLTGGEVELAPAVGEVHPGGQAAAGESKEATGGHRQAHHPSASIGSLRNYRFADFRYFYFLQEVENDFDLLRPFAAGLVRGVDDDLLDEREIP